MVVHATDAYFRLRHLQQHAKDVLTVVYSGLVSHLYVYEKSWQCFAGSIDIFPMKCNHILDVARMF